jgi:hypothetical protein
VCVRACVCVSHFVSVRCFNSPRPLTMSARKLTCIALEVVEEPPIIVNCSYLRFKSLEQHVIDVRERCRRQLPHPADQLYSVHQRQDLLSVTLEEAIDATYSYSLCEDIDIELPVEAGCAKLVLHRLQPSTPPQDEHGAKSGKATQRRRQNMNEVCLSCCLPLQFHCDS